jgi:hypothetical protein
MQKRSLTPLNLQTQRVQIEPLRSVTPTQSSLTVQGLQTAAQTVAPSREDEDRGDTFKYQQPSQAKLDAQIGPYEVGKIIGSGMIGVALVARHARTKRVFCLKCMQRSKIVEKNLGQNIKQEV